MFTRIYFGRDAFLKDDVARVEKTSDSEQLYMDLPQLDDNLPQTNYVDGLVDIFMNQ